ncbi:MAG: hypothetical protein KGJ09_08890, partial [Candidatus Omnitrophica bacterium]|nr:hypothetical protein [Candidatus Omnitrophota bacterium]
MSIINDALKRVQKQQAPKTEETNGQAPVEYLTPPKSKIKSVLAFLCALAILAGCFIFLYRQLNVYFPKLKWKITLPFNKLFHKEEIRALKAAAPALPPLARINTGPQSASQGQSSAGTTLNIHGVMSEGSRNVVLIDDQVYQEGDEVDGVKIVKIGLDAITVINNGR